MASDPAKKRDSRYLGAGLAIGIGVGLCWLLQDRCARNSAIEGHKTACLRTRPISRDHGYSSV